MRAKQKIDIGLYFLILIALISYRYIVLMKFGFEYSDSDQAIMWNALMNYSEGLFHEPRFYGQNYNTMLEALLAVPLYKMGVPFYKALPIVTSFISIFPYVIISCFTFRKKSTFLGLVILSIPFLLPIEYHLITSLSRGFVTGIFVASFGSIALFNNTSRWSFFLLSTLSVIGYSINANSVLISLICLFYLFLINKKRTDFYILSGGGLVLGGLAHLWINNFYVVNPGYNIHKLHLSYSFELLVNSFHNLDQFFNNVTPIFWNAGFVSILIFLIVGIVLIWKRKFLYGLVIISIPILIILTLGVNKIHDGTGSIFMPLSRMYLALPILIAISISFIRTKKSLYVYFIIPAILMTYNINQLDTSIIENLSPSKKQVVGVEKVDRIINECITLNKVCAKNNVELVVIVNHYFYDFINYGCTACAQGFPKTLRPSYERRTWRLLEDENKVYTTILFIDLENKLDQDFSFVEQIESRKGEYIVRGNQLNTMALLEKMNIQVREYK